MAARQYDPKLGRFISADTIVPGAGNPQALNRFSYVLNRPLNFRDPSGHSPVGPLILLSIGTGVVGALGNTGGYLLSELLLENKSPFEADPLKVAAAAGTGFAAGALTPVTLLATRNPLAIGGLWGVASGVQFLIGQKIDGDDDWGYGELAANTVAGGIGGMGGGPLGASLAKGFDRKLFGTTVKYSAAYMAKNPNYMILNMLQKFFTRAGLKSEAIANFASGVFSNITPSFLDDLLKKFLEGNISEEELMKQLGAQTQQKPDEKESKDD